MATWYVAPAAAQGGIGSDSNSGTSAGSPFATFSHAASVVSAGDLVLAATGDYPGGFTTNCAGTLGNPITFRSSARWGARITVPASNAATILWQVGNSGGTAGNFGAYVTVDGFHFDGSTYTSGTAVAGMIWCFGTGDIVQNCKVHDINNSTTTGGGGIMMDAYYGGINMAAYGNYIYNIIGTGSGIYNYQGIYCITNCTVIGNLIINTSSDCISSYHGATTLYISNNTCISGHTGITIDSGNNMEGQYQTAGCNNCRVFNNICVNCTYGIYESSDGTGSVAGNEYQYNDLYLNTTNTSLTTGAASNNITSNPLFNNYNAGAVGGDFHLQSTSPCVNGGTSGLAPAIATGPDQDGHPIPFGTIYPIGCYDYYIAGTPVMNIVILN